MTMLTVLDISKRFGPVVALAGCSFSSRSTTRKWATRC
jgi:hypothetical protein